MVVLTEKFRFIRDDVFLCPWVDSETGKQKLFIQKINLETNEVEFEDQIDCIHTAVTNISTTEFEDYQNDTDDQELLVKKTLDIRSSEKLTEINLTLEEKYFALKSWVASIADSNNEAFKVQSEIERYGHLAFPISNFLMRFMARADQDFLPDYLTKIEHECIYQGVKSESFILASLMPILNALNDNYINQELDNRRKFDINRKLSKDILILERPKLPEFDAQILERIIENPTFNLKVQFLLKFHIYIVYIAHKMKSDKNYLPNCIQKLISNKRKLIAFLIPILKLLFDDYRLAGKSLFGDAVGIIEDLGFPKNMMTQMYYKVYNIESREFNSYDDSTFGANNLIFNDISRVYGLKYMNNLKVLKIGGNLKNRGIKIREIKGLGHLTKLRELDLSLNNISIIEGLDHLRNLRILKIWGNKIKIIENIYQLPNLEELYLANNEITKIEGLNKLTKLKTLHLVANKIEKIEGLEKLTNLQILKLNNNKIEKIEGLDQLKNLKKLYIGGNKITKIEGLNQLTNLKELHLDGNEITEIEGFDHLPPNLKDYLPPNLEILDLGEFSFYNPIPTFA